MIDHEWHSGQAGWQEVGEILTVRFVDGTEHIGSISQTGLDYEDSELIFWSYTDEKDYPLGLIASWKMDGNYHD